MILPCTTMMLSPFEGIGRDPVAYPPRIATNILNYMLKIEIEKLCKGWGKRLALRYVIVEEALKPQLNFKVWSKKLPMRTVIWANCRRNGFLEHCAVVPKVSISK